MSWFLVGFQTLYSGTGDLTRAYERKKIGSTFGLRSLLNFFGLKAGETSGRWWKGQSGHNRRPELTRIFNAVKTPNSDFFWQQPTVGCNLIQLVQPLLKKYTISGVKNALEMLDSQKVSKFLVKRLRRPNRNKKNFQNDWWNSWSSTAVLLVSKSIFTIHSLPLKQFWVQFILFRVIEKTNLHAWVNNLTCQVTVKK